MFILIVFKLKKKIVILIFIKCNDYFINTTIMLLSNIINLFKLKQKIWLNDKTFTLIAHVCVEHLLQQQQKKVIKKLLFLV